VKALIYDIEIVKAIVGKDGVRLPDINYCDGWNDHANMGVSVIGAYDYAEDRYRTFCADNFYAFEELAKDRLCVGFNSIKFDNTVLAASDIVVPDVSQCYDLLRETWIAAGAGNGDPFNFKLHGGYGLDAMCKVNFGTAKTGNGALAPVLWQRGEIGKVIDYCLNDVRLTKQLFDKVLAGELLLSPVSSQSLKLRVP